MCQDNSRLKFTHDDTDTTARTVRKIAKGWESKTIFTARGSERQESTFIWGGFGVKTTQEVQQHTAQFTSQRYGDAPVWSGIVNHEECLAVEYSSKRISSSSSGIVYGQVLACAASVALMAGILYGAVKLYTGLMG